METSKILARIIGPVMIIPAIGLFLNFAEYQRLYEEFAKSPSLCYLGGFMALLMGLIILQFHNKWEAGWPVLITILGWITLIKGLVLVLFPASVLNLWHPLTASPTALIVSLVISGAVGVFLTVKGYWG
jgi:hypothetical protein